MLQQNESIDYSNPKANAPTRIFRYDFTINTKLTAPIPIVADEILGIPAPVTGKSPVTSITATDRYTGTVTWTDTSAKKDLGPSDKFENKTVYKATITLTPKSGYVFTESTGNFRVRNATNVWDNKMGTASNAGKYIVPAFFDSTKSPEEKPEAAINYRTEKLTGFAAASSYSIKPANNVVMDITNKSEVDIERSWFGTTLSIVKKGVSASTLDSDPQKLVIPARPPAPARVVGVGETAAGAGDGRLTGVTAAMEWKHSDSVGYTQVTGTEVGGLKNGTYNVRVTATGTAFVGVAANVEIGFLSVVDIAAINGVTAPVAKATPVTSITASAQYTGKVVWSPTVASGGTFAENTVYTATITLTPTALYTLTGVAANFFTVAGASEAAANSANSGVITAKFPATSGPTKISPAIVYNFTTPAAGVAPNVSAPKTTSTEFTVTSVAWSPMVASGGTFAANIAYKAIITLTAKSGYTFVGVGVNAFAGKVDGAVVTNPAGAAPGTTLIVTAQFPATVNGRAAIEVSKPKPFVPLLVCDLQPPAWQTVTIANKNGVTIALVLDSSNSNRPFRFEVDKLSAAVLGSGATFTVRPKMDLPIGEHSDTLRIKAGVVGGAHDTVVNVPLSFEVMDVAAYRLTIPELDHFGFLPRPYNQPPAQTVVVTNTGTESITLRQPTSIDYEIGSLSRLVLATNGATATFTVRPNANLAAGEHIEPIMVIGARGDGGEIVYSAGVLASFVVEDAGTYRIDASALTSFGYVEYSANASDYAVPPEQIVTVANIGTGTGTVTVTIPTSSKYRIVPLTATPSSEMGAMLASFSIQPNGAGLPAGNNDENIMIIGKSSDITCTTWVFATFTLKPIRSIGVSRLESFGNLPNPYTQPEAQTVTVTNTGAGATTLSVSAASAGHCVIGQLSKATLPAEDSAATFTVRPKPNLPMGNYKDTITIKGTGGAFAIVVASFTVAEAVSVKEAVREVPSVASGGSEGSIAPPRPAASVARIVAGPNRVLRKFGHVNFYLSGARVADATLFVYDAVGGLVGKVRIADAGSGIGSLSKRVVGRWDPRDRYGRPLPEGTYLARGAVAVNGKRETVSIPLGIVE